MGNEALDMSAEEFDQVDGEVIADSSNAPPDTPESGHAPEAEPRFTLDESEPEPSTVPEEKVQQVVEKYHGDPYEIAKGIVNLQQLTGRLAQKAGWEPGTPPAPQEPKPPREILEMNEVDLEQRMMGILDNWARRKEAEYSQKNAQAQAAQYVGEFVAEKQLNENEIETLTNIVATRQVFDLEAAYLLAVSQGLIAPRQNVPSVKPSGPAIVRKMPVQTGISTSGKATVHMKAEDVIERWDSLSDQARLSYLKSLG